MNNEAKILYYRKLFKSLQEDIVFLKILLSKIGDAYKSERENIYRLLNAYIEEKNRASILLAQLNEEIIGDEEINKSVYEEYLQNKNIPLLCKYIYEHYTEDLLKIRDILNTLDKENNIISENFVRLTPIERMSLYQVNMDFNGSK